jgi:protein-disulfide isomerase
MKKGLVIALIIVVLGVVGFLATHPPVKQVPSAGTETAAQLAETPPKEAPVAAENPPETAPAPVVSSVPAGEVDVEAAMAERSLGRDDAPVTVIEYASLTCPHCAHFAADILPEVKTKLIETGKMRLIFRDFPLDQMAMKAAKMARCAPRDKYFDLLEVIFKNQTRWLTTKEPEVALSQLGALTGMDEAYIKNCMGNAELETRITVGMSEAQNKFFVKSTPTFVFNFGAESLSGAQDEAKFEEVVNRLTAGKQ